MVDLLEQLMYEPVYDTLRTKEQLGAQLDERIYMLYCPLIFKLQKQFFGRLSHEL